MGKRVVGGLRRGGLVVRFGGKGFLVRDVG